MVGNPFLFFFSLLHDACANDPRPLAVSGKMTVSRTCGRGVVQIALSLTYSLICVSIGLRILSECIRNGS